MDSSIHIAAMRRIYEEIITAHFAANRQMLFLSGPRQVGKTTCACTALPDALYLNWDREEDRAAILYCFLIRPWTTNLSRSLLKEPKVYLWDWSVVADKGTRYETIIAGHLLKAVHTWSDQSQGEYALHYLRTKDQREVDFLVARDGKPWFLVEVKSSDTVLSPHLRYFYDRLSPAHAFQVVMEADYAAADCFEHKTPVWVPARTFLSQLP
jgi:predicted AAA+ superfamily ATPase